MLHGTTTTTPDNVGTDLPDYVPDKYEIEPLNGSNLRPGMNPEHRWLVRYDSMPSPLSGWACCTTFSTKLEAVQFVETKFAPIKKYDLGFGFLGNGTTVYNRADLNEHNDYPTVAHIEDDGTVKIYDKDMPFEVRERIMKFANA